MSNRIQSLYPKVIPTHNVLEQSKATLYEALFARSHDCGTSIQVDGDDTPLCDKVDQYLAMSVLAILQ
jgi:hypothetical protein